MLLRKKVLPQEGFPSCGRTFFRRNIWKNLLPRLCAEEGSSARSHDLRLLPCATSKTQRSSNLKPAYTIKRERRLEH